MTSTKRLVETNGVQLQVTEAGDRHACIAQPRLDRVAHAGIQRLHGGEPVAEPDDLRVDLARWRTGDIEGCTIP